MRTQETIEAKAADYARANLAAENDAITVTFTRAQAETVLMAALYVQRTALRGVDLPDVLPWGHFARGVTLLYDAVKGARDGR